MQQGAWERSICLFRYLEDRILVFFARGGALGEIPLSPDARVPWQSVLDGVAGGNFIARPPGRMGKKIAMLGHRATLNWPIVPVRLRTRSQDRSYICGSLKGNERAYVVVPCCGLLIAAPFLALAVLGPAWRLSLLLPMSPVAAIATFLAPGVALIQNISPPARRAVF
jgi:hypothetical protein